jgi:hypothetical protein
MSVLFINVGGGQIGRDYKTNPWQQYFPATIPSCCNTGLPEAALYYDPKYVFDFSPSRQQALGCYLAAHKPKAGDKLVGSVIHAGIDFHTLSLRNANGCVGWSYHLEVHDLYAIAAESAGGAASAALVTFPTINGATAQEKHYDVRALHGAAPLFGDSFGTVTVNGEVLCCKKHLALVLVIDALPDAGAKPTGNCPAQPCDYGAAQCKDVGPLDCVDFTASAHVFVPGGVRNT